MCRKSKCEQQRQEGESPVIAEVSKIGFLGNDEAISK